MKRGGAEGMQKQMEAQQNQIKNHRKVIQDNVVKERSLKDQVMKLNQVKYRTVTSIIDAQADKEAAYKKVRKLDGKQKKSYVEKVYAQLDDATGRLTSGHAKKAKI